MKKKGDIPINAIFAVVLTIISIVLLLMVFSSNITRFAKSIYCKTFFYVFSSTYIPRSLRADQNYCVELSKFPPIPVPEEGMTLNMSILGHVIACWESMDYGKHSENALCYELTVRSTVPAPVSLTEEELTRIISKERMCSIMPNNQLALTPPVDFNCGEENKIIWKLGDTVYPEQNILIEYNSERREIIVS